MFGENKSIAAVLRRSLLVITMVGSVVAVPQAASAAPAARNGRCEPGEFCLYPEYDLGGSVSDFTTSIRDYGRTQPTCYEFKGPGNGRGLCVKNRAFSGWNNSNRPVRLYYNSGYGGIHIEFAPGDARDGGLGPLDANNASHEFR